MRNLKNLKTSLPGSRISFADDLTENESRKKKANMPTYHNLKSHARPEDRVQIRRGYIWVNGEPWPHQQTPTQVQQATHPPLDILDRLESDHKPLSFEINVDVRHWPPNAPSRDRQADQQRITRFEWDANQADL